MCTSTYVDITQKNKYSLKNIWIVSIYGYKNSPGTGLLPPLKSRLLIKQT
jgi:hypothetical protein